VIPEAAPNAFATGRSPSTASVALTEGLLQQLTASEIEAVIAQQLALVRCRYTLLATVTAAITGSFACVTNFLLWGTLAPPVAGEAPPVSPFAGLSRLVFHPVARLLIRLCSSAEQQQDADRKSVEWTGAPLPLASALGKIAGRAPWTPMYSGGPETAQVFLVNPFPSEVTFRTHPETQQRIRLLEAMSGWKQHAA
jgi:heat shock protein HtpX